MAKAGRPKNDGTVLVVRVSTEAHSSIAFLQSWFIGAGLRPGLATKARSIEEALLFLMRQIELANLHDSEEVTPQSMGILVEETSGQPSKTPDVLKYMPLLPKLEGGD